MSKSHNLVCGINYNYYILNTLLQRLFFFVAPPLEFYEVDIIELTLVPSSKKTTQLKKQDFIITILLLELSKKQI